MISKRTIQNLFVLLAVLATVLMSKSYYFGVANRGTFQYIYYATVILARLGGWNQLAKNQKCGFDSFADTCTDSL